MSALARKAARGAALIVLATVFFVGPPAQARVPIALGPLALYDQGGGEAGKDLRVLDLIAVCVFRREEKTSGESSWRILALPMGGALVRSERANASHATIDVLRLPVIGSLYQLRQSGEQWCHEVLGVNLPCSGP